MYAILPGEEVERDYPFLLLLTKAFSAYAELESLRVAMPKVSREALGVVRLSVPPLEEQSKIAEFCHMENDRHQKGISSIMDRG